MRAPRSILITGGSSGLGAALALAYAAPGVALALSGRDPARTEAVAELCRAKGAAATGRICDVTDRGDMRAWIAEADRTAPLDLVVANAGISDGPPDGGESEDETGHILAVNIDGVVNTVLPAIELMQARPAQDGVRGQIAIMSSLAGFRGYPGAPAYAASKAAIRVWGESLRARHHAEGILVSVICPGFVATPMTEGGHFPQPFKISAERAVRIVRSGLARDRGRIAFPFPTYFLAWLGATLPERMTDPALRRMARRE